MGNKNTVLLSLAAASFFAFLVFRGNDSLHPLVPGQRTRGTDGHGSGAFGASRGTKKHNGIDIIVRPGQAIQMPFTGKVVRMAHPYPDDLSWEGLAIQNEKYFAKIYYMVPLNILGQTITAGSVMGHAQDIGKRYKGITPHVHLEIWDRSRTNVAIDPTNLF